MAWQQQRYPKPDMLARKEEGVWKKYSTAEVQELSRKFAAGLLSLGFGGEEQRVEEQVKIAILSANRPEWLLTDLACQQAGAVLAPIYPTISEPELEFVLNDSAARALFVSDIHLFEKVQHIRDRLPHLRQVFSYDRISGVRHWSEVPALATPELLAEVESISDAITADHLATILYTSGTTGIPKGVMLTHRNILSNVLACAPYLPVFPESRALSFLPLNHIFERMVSYLYMTAGVSIYYAESMETISDNLREVKPGIFSTVPRLLEKVYEKIMAKGLALKGIKRYLFFWAVNLGKQYEINQPQSFWYRLQLAIANKLVFSKWREALGGNLQGIITGAAACQVRLLKIFTAAGMPILEGYGLTETSPVIAVNRFEENDRMFGTVGPLISGVEVKLAEDGEILCKGPNVTIGYYKRPDLTAESIKDGWFHTGDVGTLVAGRFLKITDRKKELFKTSGGKFVAPQPVENKFKESPFIEQIMVVGADRKFAGALIVPNFSNLADWACKQGLSFDTHEQLLQYHPVTELFKQAVDKYNQFFNHIEQVKKFELLPQEWTVAGGELTPTLKLKRKVITEKYSGAIERIYS